MNNSKNSMKSLQTNSGLNTNMNVNERGTILLLGVMAILLVLSITGFFAMWFTNYYNNSIFSEIILKRNSQTTNSWMNPHSKYDTLLKVHIFNYTNIEKYMLGKENKIKVDDIGPLTYKEHTTKVNVSFNNNYTITFRDHRTYEFLPNKSSVGELSKMFVPNVPLLTAAVKVDNLDTIAKYFAMKYIQSYNEPIFKMISAREFLWGYRDRIVSLDVGSRSKHFGLLMNRNGTSVDSLQINTGEDDIRKFGKISQFNGEPLLKFWSEKKCNLIDGSDGTMFPPKLVEKRDKLHVFLQVLCRKIPLHFEKEVTILNNINVFRYRTPLNIFATSKENPENQCYCQNTYRCLPSGVINATKCYDGAPIFPSFPHFFSGDSIIYKDFEGIKPDAFKHQTFADIHPRFAFPITGASRVQINIAIHNNTLIKSQDKYNTLRNGLILPLIWIEITSGDFTDDILDKLYISTFGLNTIESALKYGTFLTLIVSCCLIVYGFNYLSNNREKVVFKKT